MIWDLPSQSLGLIKTLCIFSLENIVWSGSSKSLKNFLSLYFGTLCYLKNFITNYSLFFKGNTMNVGYFTFLCLSNASIHCHFTHSFSMHDSPAIKSLSSFTQSPGQMLALEPPPHPHMELSFPSSLAATGNHLPIFSEINKTFICPKYQFLSIAFLILALLLSLLFKIWIPHIFEVTASFKAVLTCKMWSQSGSL